MRLCWPSAAHALWPARAKQRMRSATLLQRTCNVRGACERATQCERRGKETGGGLLASLLFQLSLFALTFRSHIGRAESSPAEAHEEEHVITQSTLSRSTPACID